MFLCILFKTSKLKHKNFHNKALHELFEKLRQIIVQRHLEGLGLKWVVWSHISLRQWAHEDIWNQVRIVWFHISSPTLGGRRVFETKQELFGFISLKPRGKDDIWNQARQTPSSQLSLHSADCTVGSSETQINVFWDPAPIFCTEPFVPSALIM